MRTSRTLFLGLVLIAVASIGIACWQMSERVDGMRDPNQPSLAAGSEPQTGAGQAEHLVAQSRRRMVEQQLSARDITDRRVLDAMRQIPRHLFVPKNMRARAYVDGPLPIGHNQTISQPYIVALMTQLARPHPSAVALDVGTGSGYQAAVLSQLCEQVYSIEIVPPLAQSAQQRLQELGFRNVHVRLGDGYRGWPEKGPFDLIIVAAAPERVPQPLIDQLKPGGRLVMPVGKREQYLVLIEKQLDGSVGQRRVAPVAFVPMTGEVLRGH